MMRTFAKGLLQEFNVTQLLVNTLAASIGVYNIVTRSYEPERLGGFGDGPRVNPGPNHTGHSREDLLAGLKERLGGFAEGVQPRLVIHTGHPSGEIDQLRKLIRYVFYTTPEDILKPGGTPIGAQGSSPQIREITGTIDDALDLLAQLAQAGGGFTDITPPTYTDGIMIRLNSGGIVAVRDKMTRSPGTNATLDVDVPTVPEIKKIKFNP